MGISHKSHGKKTNKETQSPLLKIFRDIDQKGKDDPEKTNLLHGKHMEKKRKHFLGYRSKSDQKTSSNSDIQHHYKSSQEQELRSAEYHRSQSHSLPFHASKSWVFWGDKSSKKEHNDDTCSCVSCALKKLISNDYACIGCLTVLFTISVIIACVLVYKCIPTIANTTPVHESERLKRKIDSINGWGSFMPKTFSSNKNRWQDSSFLDLGPIDADSELSKIIDDTKLSEIQGNERLRDFYKKLIQADSKIRKLKKSTDFTTFDTHLDFDFKTLPEREKRSVNFLKKPLKLFHFKKHKSNKTKIAKSKLKDANLTKIEKSRHKRLNNGSGDTIVFEKDQVLIQYKPRIVPKCSHNIPKDVKSHEHLLKHPFYKNTQRLDELLDHFNKNLPDILNQQFGLPFDFNDEKSHSKHTKVNAGENKNQMIEHQKNKMTDKPKEKLSVDTYKTDYDLFRKIGNGHPNMEGAKTNGYADFDGDPLKRDDITTNNYDLLLSISTVLNQKPEKRTTPYSERMDMIPNLRRLLQTDVEEDEAINYEDLKEVLTDDDQEHDDGDKQNRKKRMDDSNIPKNGNPQKYHPPNVNNPNWKGPMPLYPDEINSMIKQEPVVNRVENPLHEDKTDQLSDLDYIEDYLDNRYQGLVKLAQAYSDYGVLNSKKGAVTEKGASEGIRFEIHPTSKNRDDNLLPIYSFIEKHVKVTKNYSPRPGYIYSTVTVPRINVRMRKYEDFKKNNVVPPLIKDKRSITTLDGLNLHRVPLEYHKSLVSIDLKNDKVMLDKRNGKDLKNNKNYLIIQGDNPNKLKETANNLNDKVIIENDDDNSKVIFKKRSLKAFKDTQNSQEFDDEITNFINSEKIIIKRDLKYDNSSKIIVNEDKSFEDSDNTQFAEEKPNFNTEINEGNNSGKRIIKRDFKYDDSSKSRMNEDVTKENASFNRTSHSEMDISDFFMMLSNIFSAMDVEDVTTEAYNITVPSTNSTSVKSNVITSTKSEVVTDIMYPMYDSEMIDNIGHRSRVLMSVNSTPIENETEGAYSTDSKKPTNITNQVLSKNKNLIKNKTARIVKRHAVDNTIFWNDIYDDEYGVKMDVFENIKDKSSVTNEFLKRSNEWIQDKVKRISDNFHRSTTEDSRNEKRLGRSIGNRLPISLVRRKSDNFHRSITEDSQNEKILGRSIGNRYNSGYGRYNYNDRNNKILNRRIRNPEDSEDKRTDFSALTVHMKDVCRRAAAAVRESENEDKGDKSDEASTGLMQQLVSLMNDLIDFKVQQKTCMKLPQDLYNFLEWLTDVTPTDSDASEESPTKLMYTISLPDANRDEKPSDHPTDHPSDMPSEREDQDPRSDCLGTLQAIQDLLRSFEDMTNDDKNKMTGVKEYLLTQLSYLKKRLADEEYNNSLHYQEDPFRYKRDQSRHRHHRFLRNYSKKHTKTTASYYDGVTFSEPFGTLTRKKVKEKRNLRDIYYKAVADAKKITTVKSHHRTR